MVYNHDFFDCAQDLSCVFILLSLNPHDMWLGMTGKRYRKKLNNEEERLMWGKNWKEEGKKKENMGKNTESLEEEKNRKGASNQRRKIEWVKNEEREKMISNKE